MSHAEEPVGDADERVRVVAGNLRVDAAAAEVTRALAGAGIESVLLKGASIARWLYSTDDPRGYNDADLLVSPAALATAGHVLAGLGFERRYDIDGLPEWWLEHAEEWWREQDRVWIDLHSTLPGIGVSDEEAWPVLAQNTEPLTVAGQPLSVLNPAGRALNIALHAAHHGEGWGKPLGDMERALADVDDEVWQRAAQLAAELEASDAFGTGLRLLPPGVALAERLALPANRSVGAALRAGRPAPMALGFEQLSTARGMGARLRIAARKVVPPRGFMRHWYPPAERSRLRLVYAYLYRPFWLMRHAAGGWDAWREARRQVRRG